MIHLDLDLDLDLDFDFDLHLQGDGVECERDASPAVDPHLSGRRGR